jgi:hypothetical protein
MSEKQLRLVVNITAKTGGKFVVADQNNGGQNQSSIAFPFKTKQKVSKKLF